MRIFIAILFKQDFINKLIDIKQSFIKQKIEGRYTSDMNFHLTLHYIGECDAITISKIKNALNVLQCHRFKTQSLSIGLFKQHKPKKIVFLGVEKNSDLLRCHDLVINALKHVGIEITTEGYTPHITIGRQVLISNETIDRIVNDHYEIPVDAIHIMESKRVNDALIYQSIEKIELN